MILNWAGKDSHCRHFGMVGNSRATVDDTNHSLLTVFFTDINALYNFMTSVCNKQTHVRSPLCENVSSIFHTYIQLCTNLSKRKKLFHIFNTKLMVFGNISDRRKHGCCNTRERPAGEGREKGGDGGTLKLSGQSKTTSFSCCFHVPFHVLC